MIKKDIVAIVCREYGIATAHAVLVAIEVAAKRWTAEDTVDYGTKAMEGVKLINK